MTKHPDPDFHAVGSYAQPAGEPMENQPTAPLYRARPSVLIIVLTFLLLGGLGMYAIHRDCPLDLKLPIVGVSLHVDPPPKR